MKLQSLSPGIYLHWPFCSKICNYCNFNKYAQKDDPTNQRLGQCLLKEAQYLLKNLEIKQNNTIYFGGGTPSLMPPSLIHVIMANL